MPFRALRFSESLSSFVESKTSVFSTPDSSFLVIPPHRMQKATQAAPRQCRYQCDIPYLLKISSLIFKMVPANILISPNGTSWLYQGIAGQSPLPNMPYLPFQGFSNQLSGYHGLLVLPYPPLLVVSFSLQIAHVSRKTSLLLYTFCTNLTAPLSFSLDPGTLEDTSFYIGRFHLFSA